MRDDRRPWFFYFSLVHIFVVIRCQRSNEWGSFWFIAAKTCLFQFFFLSLSWCAFHELVTLSLSLPRSCVCVCRLTIDGQLILGLRSVLSWLCCGHHWSPLMIGWVCMCCCFPSLSLSLFMHVHETLTPKDNILIETIMRSHPPILSLNLSLWGRKIFFVKLFKCSLKIFPMKRTNCSSFPF